MLKSNEKLNIAYEYCDKALSREEIFQVLKIGDDILKPIAVLNLESIESKEEGELLLSHLTGVDGKIREAVSLKIAELYTSYSIFLQEPELFVDALCDVNPNVCRNILELFSNNSKWQEPLLKRINSLLDDIDTICAKFKRNKEKSHPLNIKLFNLYWCLEGLYQSCDNINSSIESVLLRSAQSYDYTIREKVAKILSKSPHRSTQLLQKLSNDVNFYVKRQLCGNI